jgi:hypothetical protein
MLPLLQVVQLLAVAAAQPQPREEFSESLSMRRLPSPAGLQESKGQAAALATFSFVTSLRNVTDGGAHHTEMLPVTMVQLMQAHSVAELRLSMTSGHWEDAVWGEAGAVGAPPGVSVWVALLGSEAATGAVREDKTAAAWSGLLDGIAGLFCPSLSQLGFEHTLSPRVFRGGGAPRRAVLHAASPQQLVCMDHLRTFTRLLPCGTASGLARPLAQELALLNSRFLSVRLHVTAQPSSGAPSELYTFVAAGALPAYVRPLVTHRLAQPLADLPAFGTTRCVCRTGASAHPGRWSYQMTLKVSTVLSQAESHALRPGSSFAQIADFLSGAHDSPSVPPPCCLCQPTAAALTAERAESHSGEAVLIRPRQAIDAAASFQKTMQDFWSSPPPVRPRGISVRSYIAGNSSGRCAHPAALAAWNDWYHRYMCRGGRGSDSDAVVIQDFASEQVARTFARRWCSRSRMGCLSQCWACSGRPCHGWWSCTSPRCPCASCTATAPTPCSRTCGRHRRRRDRGSSQRLPVRRVVRQASEHKGRVGGCGTPLHNRLAAVE